MKKLGVLLSGRGSNFMAIHAAMERGEVPGAEIAVVLSNKADAAGLTYAREQGLHAVALPSKGVARDEHDAQVIAALKDAGVELVILAGYMRLLTPAFISAFPQQILNIHPSLLPAFPGLDAQQQALDYGAKVAGCTVHFVDEIMDHGVIVLQRAVPVKDDDTYASLSARILEQEHAVYSEAIRRVLSGDYKVEGRRYVKGSPPLPPPPR